MGYFSDHQDIISVEQEEQKARQILAIVRAAADGLRVEAMECLHVGCTEGAITGFLAGDMKRITGVDFDEESIRFAQENYGRDNCRFRCEDATALSFHPESFDLVVCNHVYNYVSSARDLANEIHRVLKNGGLCYFAATQFGRDKSGYNTRNLSYRNLRKLVACFDTEDYTIEVLRNPDVYCLHKKNLLAVVGRALHFILLPLLAFFPSYIWILRKNPAARGRYMIK